MPGATLTSTLARPMLSQESEPHAHTRSYLMSSVTSLATLLGAISVPGLALALVSARARRYLRSIERQPARHEVSRARP